MLEQYIYHGKERLRCGYTTGSCAAAAAKAAAAGLLSGQAQPRVELMTPKGILLSLEVQDFQIETSAYASCAIEKDSGDDPDITKGILVYARVEYIKGQQDAQIIIDGGTGVGRVTRPGLDQPVGAAAINSTPRQMIKAAVSEVLEEYEYKGSLKVTIFVPEGASIAARTFNPRLGIEGGISILGTSGIVEPMSNEALLKTIRIEENMRRREGRQYLFLTLGNYSRQFLSDNLPDIMDQSVKCSNFIGEAIDYGLEFGFRGILLMGHIGKLVKLGAGIMNTHSAQADGRMEVLVTCGLLAGVASEVLKELPDCVTVEEALTILRRTDDMERTMDVLMQRISYHLNAKVKNAVPVGALVFSNRYGLLGETDGAHMLLEKVLEEASAQRERIV